MHTIAEIKAAWIRLHALRSKSWTEVTQDLSKANVLHHFISCKACICSSIESH
jgi:hypothetical protein